MRTATSTKSTAPLPIAHKRDTARLAARAPRARARAIDEHSKIVWLAQERLNNWVSVESHLERAGLLEERALLAFLRRIQTVRTRIACLDVGPPAGVEPVAGKE
jgi:hypothetical protein